MRLTSYITLLLLNVFMSISSFAYQGINPTYIPIFSINKQLYQLIELSETSPAQAQKQLNQSDIIFEKLNPAEQFLYFIIKSNNQRANKFTDNINQQIEQSHKSISYLLQAKLLVPLINYDQLNDLPFLNLYKKLAINYAQTAQFKNAYNANKNFITKYDVYIKNKRDRHIFELENQYETKRIKEVSTLLNNQTALKALEIDKSLQNDIVQRRNLYIVIFFMVLFLSLIIRLLLTNKRINELAKKDMLTGAINSETLFKQGATVITRCIEQRQGLCLLAIKIKDFKTLNDLNGDYIGDEVLKQFVALSIETMRTRDIFARLEGATFIALLPEAPVGEAKAIAQHLKDKISAFNFKYIGIHQKLTINVSIVELSESLNNVEQLINSAIKGLYEISDNDENDIQIYQ